MLITTYKALAFKETATSYQDGYSTGWDAFVAGADDYCGNGHIHIATAFQTDTDSAMEIPYLLWIAMRMVAMTMLATDQGINV